MYRYNVKVKQGELIPAGTMTRLSKSWPFGTTGAGELRSRNSLLGAVNARFGLGASRSVLSKERLLLPHDPASTFCDFVGLNGS